MDDIKWFYSKGHEMVGPIYQNELKSLLRDGTLTSRNWVWNSELPNWMRVEDVEGLRPQRFETSPLPQQFAMMDDTQALPLQENVQSEKPSVWLRCGARLLDTYVAAFTFCSMAWLVARPVLEWPPAILCMLIILFCMVWEAFLLWKWGQTPGKWLIASQIVHPSGRKIDFKTALQRSFLVSFDGSGSGLLVLSLLSRILKNKNLLGDLEQTLDEGNQFILVRENDYAWKIAVLCCALAMFTLFICVKL